MIKPLTEGARKNNQEKPNSVVQKSDVAKPPAATPKVKKGNLNYDQTGKAHPDNPEVKENWDCIWEHENKFYKIIGLPNHAEWEEIKR